MFLHRPKQFRCGDLREKGLLDEVSQFGPALVGAAPSRDGPRGRRGVPPGRRTQKLVLEILESLCIVPPVAQGTP